MYYDNSHLIENNHLIFHINDYKAHLSSLPSQFDKLISIGLNICIKIAVLSQNYTAKAAKLDEWLVLKIISGKEMHNSWSN